MTEIQTTWLRPSFAARSPMVRKFLLSVSAGFSYSLDVSLTEPKRRYG